MSLLCTKEICSYLLICSAYLVIILLVVSHHALQHSLFSFFTTMHVNVSSGLKRPQYITKIIQCIFFVTIFKIFVMQ